MSNIGSTPRGASALNADDGKRKTRPWWLVVLLVVGALLLVLLLSRCNNNDGTGGSTDSTEGATSGTPSSSASASASADDSSPQPTDAATAEGGEETSDAPAETPTSGVTPAPASGATDVLTSGRNSLLSGTGTPVDLAQFEGRRARADGVEVLTVPADEGFWVGSSETDRVWVQLEGSGESPYQVQEGDKVQFAGKVVAHAEGFAEEVGVSTADGAQQLTTVGHHLAVKRATLALSQR